MRDERSLKYISNRIIFMATAILMLLVLKAGGTVFAFFHGEASLFSMVLSLLFPMAYLLISWIWIIRPYKKSEKWMLHFLDGYVISDLKDMDSFLITPSMKRQVEIMNEIFKSPQTMDLNKRQAQYLALQNQINPHFLYNTLESIRGEALIAGLDGVADMTEALAKFFRYTITKVENLVTVEEELDNCETYFQIQKYRFGDRLNLHIRCSQEDWDVVMNCRIPKLTLQPILENSIIHGTEVKIGTGNLSIAFERTDKRLMVRISDDGVGMDEATLSRLNRRLGKGSSSAPYRDEGKKGGIALVNVNNRIHLLFGEEYGMHVYSVPGRGTDVEISLPIEYNAEQIKAGAFGYETRSSANGESHLY